MNIQVNVYIWLGRILLLSVSAMSYVYNHTKTTAELIDCGGFLFQNATHIKYHYEVPLHSSVRLPSCGDRKNRFSSYWFVYSDFCGTKETASFAIVGINGVGYCINRPLLVSYDSCRHNYIFTNESMIIIDMIHSTPKEYICLHGGGTSNLLYTSAVSHLIRILDSSSEYITDVSTSFSESISSQTMVTKSTPTSTVNSSATSGPSASSSTTIETPSKSWILKIVLPSVISVIIIIIVSVIGFVCYRRRRQHQQESTAIELRILT